MSIDIDSLLLKTLSFGDFDTANLIINKCGIKVDEINLFNYAILTNNTKIIEWLLSRNYKISRQNIIDLLTQKDTKFICKIINKIDTLDFIDLVLNEVNLAILTILNDYRNIKFLCMSILNQAIKTDNHYIFDWICKKFNIFIGSEIFSNIYKYNATKCYDSALILQPLF